jgi:hypothetical protein
LLRSALDAAKSAACWRHRARALNGIITFFGGTESLQDFWKNFALTQ